MRRLSVLLSMALSSAVALAAAGDPPAGDTVDRAFTTLIEGMYKDFPEVPQIPPEIAAPWITEGSVVLLDTRSPYEQAVSHLKGARFIDPDTFTLEAVADVPRGAHVLVYCSVGWRSSGVARKMLQGGYTRVEDLYGGIFLWNNQGRPLYRGDVVVPEIHPYNALWGQWVRRGIKTTTPPPDVPEVTP